MAVDRAGNLYFSDAALHRVFLVTPDRMVSVFAGTGARGFADGPAETAQFSAPHGLALDAAGNLYVADSENDRIRRIAPDGMVSTYAGSGDQGLLDSTATEAHFNEPWGLAVDDAGTVYVADRGNHRVRVIAADGTVRTLAGSGEKGFADGPAPEAMFDEPEDVAVDGNGIIYVADSNNDRIRRIASDCGVTTLAGSGEEGVRSGRGAVARFSGPEGIALSPAGYLVIADAMNNAVRRVSRNGRVTPMAGSGISTINTHVVDGPVREAQFGKPAGVAIDARGIVYVADEWNHCIRRVFPRGVVTTYAGSEAHRWPGGYREGPALEARFRGPHDVAFDANGSVYVADTGNCCIRKRSPDGEVTTFAGSGERGLKDGPAHVAQFNSPWSLDIDAAGNLYVADKWNHRIRKVAPDGYVTTIAGSGDVGISRRESKYRDGAGNVSIFTQPVGIAVDRQGNAYVVDAGNRRLRRIDVNGVVSSLPQAYRDPSDGAEEYLLARSIASCLAVDPFGLLVVQLAARQPPYYRFARITSDGELVEVIAGIYESGEPPRFGRGLAVDTSGSVIAACYDDCIRHISPDGHMSVLAGTGRPGFADGPGATARFAGLRGVTVAPDGATYVAEFDNNRIRRIAPDGTVSTYVGSGEPDW